jgi:hypothetical protein
VRIFALALCVLCACRAIDSGIAPGDAGPEVPPEDALAARDVSPLVKTDAEPSRHYESATEAGCADKTREGFLDNLVYPDIAACSGAFSNGGVTPRILGGIPQKTSCGRQAGNTGVNPKGANCYASDLCAPGWHVCVDALDVRRHTPTDGCGGCVDEGDDRFFLVGMGASIQGVCTLDPSAKNDLHGCGGLGQAEDPSCAPLYHRLSFADCLVNPSWYCGTETDQFNEADIVSKPGSDQGGVLCCRD